VVRSANGVDAIALECSALNADGTLADPHATRAAGGPGGTSATERCPAGHVIAALSGRSDIRVTRIAVRCAALQGGTVATPGAQTLPEHGGNAGDPFSDSCPSGYALTGLEGRANPEGVVSVRAACTRVAPPNGPNYSINATQHRALTARGVATVGTHFALQCPVGEIAIGVSGRHTSMVSMLSLDCAHVYPDGSIGDARSRGDAGGVSGEDFEDHCPAGEMLVGLNGRTGRVVDRVGVQCAPIARWMTNAGELHPSAGHGGNGGDPFVDNCPTGHVVDGVSGSAGNLVDSVQVQCVRLQR
jgi:hypothetical protein